MARFIPPMTMQAFFRKSEGTWFTQRTVHHFDCTADESGESNLTITLFDNCDERVQRICEQHGFGRERASSGAQFGWKSNLKEGPPSDKYAAVLVDVPDDESGRSGRLYRDHGYVEDIPVISRYCFANDGLLTISTDYENSQGQERCWFVHDNFRVRVSTVRMMDGVNLMTYCSEFRCVSDAMLDELVAGNQALAAVPSAGLGSAP